MKLGIVAGMAALVLSAATAYAQSSAPPASGASAAPVEQTYTLGVGDQVRILVFNEPTLSGEFPINSNGSIAVPLIGDIQAVGKNTSELTEAIQNRLADGFLRDPKVSVDVSTFRPFYILGEVNKPGQYPYASGMTVLNAVATAQGFTYRADKRKVYVRREGQTTESPMALDSTLMVRPGDTIRIGERYF